MAKADLTAQRLREVLHYDPETGFFTWRRRSRCGGRKAGTSAGYRRSDGYITIRVDDSLYFAHRLAWLYMTGEWPKTLIDHKNRNTSDARWENLREATHSQNHQNSKVRTDSTYGTGISLHDGKLFRVRIHVRGTTIEVGCFETLDKARAARLAAERIHFTHSPACEPPIACPD